MDQDQEYRMRATVIVITIIGAIIALALGFSRIPSAEPRASEPTLDEPTLDTAVPCPTADCKG